MTVIRLPTPPSSAGAEPKKHGQDDVSMAVVVGGPNPVPYQPWNTDGVYWIIALPAGCAITTSTGFMTSGIPETKENPYTIHNKWFLIAAEVWTIVELTIPPPTQDAGDNTKAKAIKPVETEAAHVTSLVKGANSEGAKSEKNKENCPVTSVEAKSGSLGLSADNSFHVSEGNQMPDLSQCHEYNDNSQAFAEWKGSSQPTCPKWGPPPHLRGQPSGSSGPESQKNPSGATASIERSCGRGPNVPPFN